MILHSLLGVKGMRTAVLCLALLALGAPAALGQMGFSEQFEEARGEGTGRNAEEAEKRALQNALSSKLHEMVAGGELRDHEGLAKAVNYVAKSYAKYFSHHQVVSRKKADVTVREKGQVAEVEGCEITVKAMLNKELLRRDLLKALRMAELAKLGNRLALAFEEWEGAEEEGRFSPHAYAENGAERVFMTLRFRRVPSRTLRRSFLEDMDRGRRLSQEDYRASTLEKLKGLGGDVVLLGSVRLVFVEEKERRDDPGRRDYVFEATYWAEAYEGRGLERLGEVRAEKERRTEPARSRDEALAQLFGRLGGSCAESLIDQIIAEKEEKAEEAAARPVLLVFENVTAAHRTRLPGLLTAIEGVDRCSPLRYGRGVLVLRAAVRLDPEAFDEELAKALRDEGFSVRSASSAKYIFTR